MVTNVNSKLFPCRLHFEWDHRVSGILDEIIRRLTEQVPVQVVKGRQYDVRVLFCPIVSRAGTDIEAVLSRVRAHEPTIVIVLHHTFDQRAVIPSSSVYDSEGLILVDFLYSEDQGLLESPKNSEAFNRTACYLKQQPPAADGMETCLWLFLYAWMWLLSCICQPVEKLVRWCGIDTRRTRRFIAEFVDGFNLELHGLNVEFTGRSIGRCTRTFMDSSIGRCLGRSIVRSIGKFLARYFCEIIER